MSNWQGNVLQDLPKNLDSKLVSPANAVAGIRLQMVEARHHSKEGCSMSRYMIVENLDGTCLLKSWSDGMFADWYERGVFQTRAEAEEAIKQMVAGVRVHGYPITRYYDEKGNFEPRNTTY